MFSIGSLGICSFKRANLFLPYLFNEVVKKYLALDLTFYFF